jgi:hypothetical protein
LNELRKWILVFFFNLDLLYLQDLLRLPSGSNQMKVTVRQLRGRPAVNNWHPLLQQLKETGSSKFLVDVKTDNLDDFFQHVWHSSSFKTNFLFEFLGQSCRISRTVLWFRINFIGKSNKNKLFFYQFYSRIFPWLNGIRFYIH